MPEPAGLGWRCHSGWAVLVVVAGAASAPVIRFRQRVELLDGSLPRQPYHAAAEGGIPRSEGEQLISRVEGMAVASAEAATNTAMERWGVRSVGIVGGSRNVPSELDRILRSHALLHAAEGELYEEACADAAARCGLPVRLVAPKTIVVDAAVDQAGRTLGPPWQKDHKLAATVALAALRQL